MRKTDSHSSEVQLSELLACAQPDLLGLRWIGESGWIVLGKYLESVVSGDVRENVRGDMSRYRPGMAQEKSGHPSKSSCIMCSFVIHAESGFNVRVIIVLSPLLVSRTVSVNISKWTHSIVHITEWVSIHCPVGSAPVGVQCRPHHRSPRALILRLYIHNVYLYTIYYKQHLVWYMF